MGSARGNDVAVVGVVAFGGIVGIVSVCVCSGTRLSRRLSVCQSSQSMFASSVSAEWLRSAVDECVCVILLLIVCDSLFVVVVVVVVCFV